MTPDDNAGQLLTPRHVAAVLQFTTPRPVYRLIREGMLPASRIGGRLLIEASDVDALIAGSQVRAGWSTGPSKGVSTK
jgi:excisionase family DNA binding protein